MSARGPIVTAGEAMALFDPLREAPAGNASLYQLRFAGAESNFAISLARLGRAVQWISRVGDDPFGAMILSTLRSEGVSVDWVRTSASAQTGLFVKWVGPDGVQPLYYRTRSAACELSTDDIPPDLLCDASGVHLTGITTAISLSARGLVLELAHRAHAAGLPVTFDPNFRPALWPSGPREALLAHRELLASVSWYLCGLREGEELFQVSGAPALFDALERSGVGGAVIRVGADGALIRTGGEIVKVAPARVVPVRDEIGAGDGFAAGFTWALHEDWPVVDCVRAANAVAASTLRGTGDWETYLRRDELLEELRGRAASQEGVRSGFAMTTQPSSETPYESDGADRCTRPLGGR